MDWHKTPPDDFGTSPWNDGGRQEFEVSCCPRDLELCQRGRWQGEPEGGAMRGAKGTMGRCGCGLARMADLAVAAAPAVALLAGIDPAWTASDS